MHKPNPPGNYEDWLALTDEEREAVAAGWNAYERENIGFAYIAAGRFAIFSRTRVLDVRIGTYHGGEYVIHAYVDDAAFEALSTVQEQPFEGFRVFWNPVSSL